MKLAIMQPYFFPYLGYFQLIFASDRFVFYDDVNYIKGGWINRNRLLVNNEPKYFTVPLRGASSFIQICQVRINEENSRWRTKMRDTFRMAYRNAAYRDTGLGLLEEVLAPRFQSIGDLARSSVESILRYLKLVRSVVPSSSIYDNRNIRSQDRVLDICSKDKADTYINLIGGVHLYRSESFLRQGCRLRFLRPRLPKYSQGSKQFVPGLSIIDAVMHCSCEQVIDMLAQYELVSPEALVSSETFP